MRYWTGQEVLLGDKVKLGDADGEVVCSIDGGEYGEEHSEAQWGYLGKGVMIDFPALGLIHYIDPEEDLRLIERKRSDG
jgi:hypothetical protein